LYHSACCPIRRFVPFCVFSIRRFVSFGVLSFDVLRSTFYTFGVCYFDILSVNPNYVTQVVAKL
jgi:hypothetical protein